MTISFDTWYGYPCVIAENEFLKVTVIPQLGSRMISLYDKEKNVEILRKPYTLSDYEQSPFLYGVPVLFPPNRIEDGRFQFNGRVYQFERNDQATNCHAHGLVHDKEWSLVNNHRQTDDCVITTQYSSIKDEAVLQQFPHPFTLVMNISLVGRKLIQTVTVCNESAEPFPWGIGFHTSFQFPFGEDAKEDGGAIYASVGQRWELNHRFLPTGNMLHDVRGPLLREGALNNNTRLDDVFERATSANNEAQLTDRHTGIKVTYQADHTFKHWVLHNGDGAQRFICLEPYTCVTNAFNLSLPPHRTGVRTLRPGEQAAVTCIFEIESLD